MSSRDPASLKTSVSFMLPVNNSSGRGTNPAHSASPLQSRALSTMHRRHEVKFRSPQMLPPDLGRDTSASILGALVNRRAGAPIHTRCVMPVSPLPPTDPPDPRPDPCRRRPPIHRVTSESGNASSPSCRIVRGLLLELRVEISYFGVVSIKTRCAARTQAAWWTASPVIRAREAPIGGGRRCAGGTSAGIDPSGAWSGPRLGETCAAPDPRRRRGAPRPQRGKRRMLPSTARCRCWPTSRDL